jgi:hypothetical protein
VLATGNTNIAIGYEAGTSYNSSESNNILIAAAGVVGDNSTTRIGTDGNILLAYMSGIQGVTPANGPLQTVVIGTDGQLGSTSSGGSGIVTIDGNSSSVTGATVKITTGASNIQGTALFTPSSATELDLTFSDSNNNTGLGEGSLESLSGGGGQNSCFGTASGAAITSGQFNSCLGSSAGSTIVGGNLNVCIGWEAGDSLISNSNNVFVGASAGGNATGSENTLVGASAGSSFTSGSNNVAIGFEAGSNWTAGNSSNIAINTTATTGDANVLRIGLATGTSASNLNSAFICGITGITVTGSPVLVSSSNQLGVAVSSAKFKNDIKDIGSDSNALYKLRPVSFTWNKDSAPGLKDATDMRQYGLIAEEAVNVIPHAVNLDKDGLPFNINYQDLIGMLINEVQRLSKRIDALESK